MRHCGRGRAAVLATATVAAISLIALATPGEAAGKKRSADGACRSIAGTWSSWMSGVFGKNDTHFNTDQTITYFGINGSWSCRNGEYTHVWTLLGEQGPYRLSSDGKRLIKTKDGSVSFIRGDGGTTRAKREAAEVERHDAARKDTNRREPERKQAEAPPEPPESPAIKNAVDVKLKKADLTDSNPRDASAADITGSLKSEPAPASGKEQIMLSVRIVNESKYTAAVGYFSQDGTDEWPSYGSFHVSAGRSMMIKLACRPGKVLCMGARAIEDRAVEWGVGLVNTINDPSACMYTCSKSLETTRLLKE